MYKKIFACNDKIIPYRYHKGVYEAHYRRNGLDVFACAKDFDDMKLKFIAKPIQLSDENTTPVTERKKSVQRPQEEKNKNSVLFTEYVRQWLEIKRKTTKASTFKEYGRLCRFNNKQSPRCLSCFTSG